MRTTNPRLPALAASLAAILAAGGTATADTPASALVMAWNIDAISTFDPAQIGEVVTNELVTNTCDSLVTFSMADEREVVPSFAQSWDVSEDGQEITFHLRQGANFPSGNPVTAQDAAWSMHRVVHLGFGNAATLTEYGFTAENVEEMITASDDHTLVVRLDRPYPGHDAPRSGIDPLASRSEQNATTFQLRDMPAPTGRDAPPSGVNPSAPAYMQD